MLLVAAVSSTVMFFMVQKRQNGAQNRPWGYKYGWYTSDRNGYASIRRTRTKPSSGDQSVEREPRGEWKDVEPVPPSFRVGCINLYVIVGRESVLPTWLHTFPIQLRQKWPWPR